MNDHVRAPQGPQGPASCDKPAGPSRRLILTADDFGASLAVNTAVEEAHRNGVLTAASLMVGAPAAADAVTRARRLPGLRIGLHLAVVEAQPALPPESICELVDAAGRLRADLARAGVAYQFRARARRQLALEIAAQFRAFAATGLVLDHVNGHKHMHVHPRVAQLIVEIGAGFGLRAVRVPAEPRGPLAAAEPDVRTDLQTRLLGLWAGALRRRLRRAHLAANDNIFGLRWSGAMHEQRLLRLLPHLPAGVSEVYFHPDGDDPGGRAELAALTSPAVRRTIAACGFGRAAFADLAPA